MEPTFKNGSTVLSSNIFYWFTKPKTGEVVVFKYHDKFIIKRIMKQKKDQFFVKGDNKKDTLKIGWIQRSDIVGKVFYTW